MAENDANSFPASMAMPHACRPGCGACCIAPSISSLAKPAGIPCIHLDGDLRCRIFGRPERPGCCSGLQPSAEMCGENREQALRWLIDLEALTRPG
ncbi:MAG: YkgJ family cysteine cluster protein [Dechloromonas sp.]|nr:MAG: YkgJ family cysteine cluster protein [Dechloromonas sp.]